MNNLKIPTKRLETLILNYCRANSSFFLKVKEYLVTKGNKSYFSDNKFQEVLNLYARFFDKFKKPPKKETLKAIFDRKYQDDEELKAYFFNILDVMFSNIEYDSEYLEEEIKTFIQETRVYEAWFEGQSDVEKGDFGTLLNRVEEAVRVNFDRDLGTSIKDVDYMYDNIFKLMDEDVVDSGYSFLNSVIDGGFHNREIYCLSAIPGGFKCSHKDVKIKVRYQIDEETGEIV